MPSSKRLISVMVVSFGLVSAGSLFAIDATLSKAVQSLPLGTDMVMVVDVQELRGSPIYNKVTRHRGQLSHSRELFDQFSAETGIDPERDVEGLLLGLPLEHKGRLEDGGVIVTGRFQPDRIERVLERRSHKPVSYGGYRIYSLEKHSNSDGAALILLDDHTAVLGSLEYVKTLVDVRGGSAAGLAEDAEMMRLIRNVRPKGQVWGVAKTGGFLKKCVPHDLGKILRQDGPAGMSSCCKVTSATFSAYFGAEVELSLNVEMSSDEDAKNVADLVQGMVALGRLASADEQADVAAFLDEIDVSRSGRTLELSMVIPEALIDKKLDQD